MADEQSICPQSEGNGKEEITRDPRKLEIVANLQNGGKQASICMRLDLTKTTVSTIGKKRDSDKELQVLQFQR